MEVVLKRNVWEVRIYVFDVKPELRRVSSSRCCLFAQKTPFFTSYFCLFFSAQTQVNIVPKLAYADFLPRMLKRGYSRAKPVFDDFRSGSKHECRIWSDNPKILEVQPVWGTAELKKDGHYILHKRNLFRSKPWPAASEERSVSSDKKNLLKLFQSSRRCWSWETKTWSGTFGEIPNHCATKSFPTFLQRTSFSQEPEFHEGLRSPQCSRTQSKRYKLWSLEREREIERKREKERKKENWTLPTRTTTNSQIVLRSEMIVDHWFISLICARLNTTQRTLSWNNCFNFLVCSLGIANNSFISLPSIKNMFLSNYLAVSCSWILRTFLTPIVNAEDPDRAWNQNHAHCHEAVSAVVSSFPSVGLLPHFSQWGPSTSTQPEKFITVCFGWPIWCLLSQVSDSVCERVAVDASDAPGAALWDGGTTDAPLWLLRPGQDAVPHTQRGRRRVRHWPQVSSAVLSDTRRFINKRRARLFEWKGPWFCPAPFCSHHLHPPCGLPVSLCYVTKCFRCQCMNNSQFAPRKWLLPKARFPW